MTAEVQAVDAEVCEDAQLMEALAEGQDEEQLGAIMAEMQGDEAEEEQVAEELAGEGDEHAGELAASPPANDDEEDDEEEALADSVAGSVHLKRLLTRDEEDKAGGPASKKPKLAGVHGAEEEQLSKKILIKWQMHQDPVVAHVLTQLPMDELKPLFDSNYIPDKFNAYKSCADLLARYVCELRERKLAGGGPLDMISNFRFRWKLDMAADKLLRALCHKDLRYVLSHFDGTAKIDELIAVAKETEAEDDNCTVSSLPDAVGPSTYARFCRLELDCDPIADCAVFGDANLTFSMKLAKHRKALGHVGRVIATTFEELDTLKERYFEIESVITDLEGHFAEVYHGVDCTKIAHNPQFKGLEGSLGGVYYNFPHSGAVQGFFDGHPIVNWRHENLMRLFFRALRTYVRPGGTVKVASNMGAVGVRYSYIVGGAIENEFEHTETMPFQEWILHRYGRSYGDRRDQYKRPDATNNQSYNAQAADKDMVYCFRYAPSGKKIAAQKVRLPPTLTTLMACTDGPFKTLHGEASKNLARQLHKRFVLEVSGTHVG